MATKKYGQFWPLVWPGGGVSFVPATVKEISVTTGALAGHASEQGFVRLGKSFSLLRVTATAPCRVRLYATNAYQDNDAGRAIGTDPTGEHGCIFGGIFLSTNLTLDLSPQAEGSNLDQPERNDAIYYNITNTATTSATITVTFLRKLEEV
jgi:hypothetical protein